jgi:hypothetical protein
MVKIIGGEQSSKMEMFLVLFRYIILCLLITVSFCYIYNPNIQLIIFIVLLILVILGTIFLIKDLLSTQGLVEKIAKPDLLLSITTNSSTLLKIFLGSIGIGIIFKILSLTFLIVVFVYGRRELNASDNSSTKKLSSYNNSILKKYLIFFIISTVMMIFILLIIFITYSSVEIQIILRNILLIGLSLGTMILSILEMYYSTIFLKIRQNNGTLYEISPT